METNNTNLISSSTNLIDLASIKLSQNFQEQIGVTKKLLTIPVRKPDNQWFIRTHTNVIDYWFECTLLKFKEENEFYLIPMTIAKEMPQNRPQPHVIVTCINRHGSLFLWPIRLPDSDGKHNVWHRSALLAANEAKQKWMKIASNMDVGAYDTFEASGKIPEPEWPQYTFNELLTIAFKDRFIDSCEHPTFKKLLGAL
jgi:hypothetical protein